MSPTLARSSLPTIVRLRSDLEEWIKGRNGRVLEQATSVIDGSAVVIFQDGPTGTTLRLELEELAT
jgi:hypothetical protein